MVTTRKSIDFKLYLIIALSILIVLIIIWALIFQPNNYHTIKSDQLPEFRHELNRLKVVMDSLDLLNTGVDIDGDIHVMKEKIVELEIKFDSYEKKVSAEKTSERPNSIISLASLLVSALTIVFAAFVIVIGWMSIKKYDEMKRDLENKISERNRYLKKFDAIKKQSKIIKKSNDSIKKDIEVNREFMKNFVMTLADSIYSILHQIEQYDILPVNHKPIIENKPIIESYISETISLLFIKHPSKKIKLTNLYYLMASGSKRSIPELNEFIKRNKSEFPDLCFIAQKAISEIEKRELLRNG